MRRLIQFESTLDDRVVVQIRLAVRVGMRRQFLWQQLIVVPICGVVAYFVVADDRLLKLVIAVIIMVWTAFFVFVTYRWTYRRAVRKNLIKAVGKEPRHAEIELSDDGPAYRSEGQELRFAWSSVVEVDDEADGIWLYFEPPGVMRIPKRTLSTEEAGEWLNVINESVEAART